MSVNFEIKGMLARLLATEDIIIENKKVETACFNVHTRVLTLPIWERASNVVYDLLCAHEVGHSRETPDIDWTQEYKIPGQFVNVCEDARVEKLIKRRYAGLAKTFYAGYKELFEQDFFQISDKDLSILNLADRVNLHFKIGNLLSLEFTEREQEIVDMIGNAETFDETLNASKVLYEYCKKNSKSKSNSKRKKNSDSDEVSSSEYFYDDDESSSESSGEEESPPEDNEEEDDEDKEEEDEEEDEDNEEEDDDEDEEEQPEPDVETMNSLEENLKGLVDNFSQETTYIEVPKLNLDSVIASNQIIHDICDKTWNEQVYILGDSKIFTTVDTEYLDFKRSAQKEVNYLVKEFECRKAADSYARETVSTTGVLDCTKLHAYKYREDLFKRVTTLATGKNHGLVFILDWSGSMGNVLMDTVKQLYNLIWFCNKVNIPFEVYAFTNDWNSGVTYDVDGKVSLTSREHTVRKENELVVDYTFSLMNLFTSKVKSSVLDTQLKNIYRVANQISGGNGIYRYPGKLGLSGTPLNESLVALHQILPHFQREHKLQKVQCVILTDGEASSMKYYREIQRHGDVKSFIGTNYIPNNSYLRDRKTGNVYKFCDYNCTAFTDLLLKNLRDKFPSVNFIGMRILNSRDAGHFIRSYTGYIEDEYHKVMSRWKKEHSFSITTSGYHTYFGISSSTLNSDSEFKVSEDASKSQIKSAFVKSLSSKKMNKKILGEFIQLVA
jgi:hypothetical protein